jgi:hypothetical protein
VATILFLVAGRLSWGLGVAVGALWAIANLIFLRFILVRWLKAPDTAAGGPSLALIGGLILKFPLLYGVGYLLLASGWFRIEGLVIGFVIPFAAAFVHALGQFAAERRQVMSR